MMSDTLCVQLIYYVNSYTESTYVYLSFLCNSPLMIYMYKLRFVLAVEYLSNEAMPPWVNM